jgi:hypothetical protein
MYRRAARFNKKSPTDVKMPYSVFNPHSLTPCLQTDPTKIITTCIDPGIKNCAIRTAIHDTSTGKSQTILFFHSDFTHQIHGKETVSTSETKIGGETEYYSKVFSVFDPYIPFFIQSQYIGIESQLPINYDLVRMAQHLITYLMMVTRDKGNRPLILELSPKLKSSMLGAPPKLTKPQLKKWATEKGCSLLRADGEESIAAFIESQTKKDDYGDVVCYEKCLVLLSTVGLCQLPKPHQETK